jgi:glycosyltransferase involved in cell wall biosynthesis
MPLALSRYQSVAMRNRISSVLQTARFDSVVCDFLTPAPNFEDLRECVLFQHNVETVIWRRHAEHAPDPLRRVYFKAQGERMYCWERHVCRSVAHVIAVSPQDVAIMRELFGVDASCIPTGVDVEYFRRPEQIASKADLVFLGSMDWMPNIDGVEYFVRTVLPLIWQRRPDCSVAVVGRNPSPDILRLAKQDARITVTGTVADVRPWLWGAKVSVVPLRIGGGTRLKIYEAMAAGTPIVSTGVGAEGLDVSHPDNIRLCDAASDFAGNCLELLDLPAERQRMASEALQMVTRRFSWDVVVSKFEERLLVGTRRDLAPGVTADSSHEN